MFFLLTAPDEERMFLLNGLNGYDITEGQFVPLPHSMLNYLQVIYNPIVNSIPGFADTSILARLIKPIGQFI